MMFPACRPLEILFQINIGTNKRRNGSKLIKWVKEVVGN